MPTALFESIIQQAKEMGFKGSVGLQHYNEPLLDERLPDLLAYVRRILPESKTSFCSNADLITPELAKRLDPVINGRILVALYMPRPAQIEREQYLKSLFPTTTLHFTKGAHTITHFSPHSEQLEKKIATFINTPCTRYNRMFIISFTGEVLHCCDDYAGHFGLGNVNEKSLREIWYSEKHQKLVETLSQRGGRKQYPYCSICPRRG